MNKLVYLLVVLMISLQSCKKEEVHETIDNRKFYEFPRNTVVLETFEFGSISATIDYNSDDILGSLALVQDGVCANIEKGFLNILRIGALF